MKRDLLNVYVCPVDHSRLSSSSPAGEIFKGELRSEAGSRYKVHEGIPVLLSASLMAEAEQATQGEYDAAAEQKYDAAVDWLFKSFYENEDEVREMMIDLLRLGREAKVLEIGAGTGRDSFRIARRLGKTGEFFVQDLSEQMLLKARARLAESRNIRESLHPSINYLVSTARYLPFRDGYFDAVFHFGGFNTFSDPRKTLAEMTRIVKNGGRIVVGDESLPPWLEGTEFGEILLTNNPLFKNKAPLQSLPTGAREVTIRWILGGCFYLIDFTVGDGPPPINLDLPHKGWRGGTMRTRYYGQLEGVSLESREKAIAAARRCGISVHEWLDAVVRKAAEGNVP